MAASPWANYADAAAALMGEVPMVRGREAYFGCPFCGKPQNRRKFSINLATGFWQCWSCDAHGNFSGLERRLGGARSATESPRAVPEERARSAPRERRDRTYSALLELLTLSQKHRWELLARGFTEAEIVGGCYRSLPLPGRSELARSICLQLGDEALAGVPGFYRRTGRSRKAYWTLAGAPGLVIPVRDEEGSVVGLRLRPDSPGEAGKYRWLSSGHWASVGGAKAESDLHFAWPLGRPDVSLTTAGVTEGELKANALASRLGVLAVSVPGVGLWRKVELVRRLRQLGIKAVILAYDRDADDNLKVARATQALAEALLLNGFAVSIALWDRSLGKGVDDLMLGTRLRPELVSLREWRRALLPAIEAKLSRPRGAFDICPDDMPPPDPPAAMLGLSEAREALDRDLGGLLLRPSARRVHVFTAPPGVGKTHSLIRQIVQQRRSGEWPTVKSPVLDLVGRVRTRTVPMRLVALFPTKEALAEAYATHPELADFVVVQKGRSPDPESRWYCANFELADHLGSRRHIIRAELCRDCRFKDACPYLASLEQARRADVVFAVQQTFLNDSDELGGGLGLGRRRAHLVAIDEEFLPGLVEEVEVGFGGLGEWRDGMAQCQSEAAEGQLRQAIEGALTVAANRCVGESLPALPLLQEVCASSGVVLKELVSQLSERRDEGGAAYKVWPFEQAFRLRGSQGHGRLVVPLRLWFDLLRILREELADSLHSDRQTRLWLTRRPGNDGRLEPVMLVEVDRRKVIARLRGTTLIHLNSTPNRPLLETVFPNTHFHDQDVDVPLAITQVDNALYTAAYIRQPDRKALDTLQKTIDGICSQHRSVAVFCAKEFEPGGGGHHFINPSGEDIRWGHFGAQTRALNIYKDCDAIVVVGHYMAPPFAVEALVAALRWTRQRARVPATEAVSSRRAYKLRRPDGSGRGRIIHSHPDPLVQATLEWSTEAEIRQAIGRARAVSRAPDQPVAVYLLTAAVTSLPIDHLLGMHDLLDDLGAQPSRTSPDAHELTSANNARRHQAETHIRDAIKQMGSDGQPPTVTAVCRAAKASRHTVGRVLRELKSTVEGGVQADSIEIHIATGLHTPPHNDKSKTREADLRGEAADELGPGSPLCSARTRISWAGQRGWIHIADPFTRESCEVRAHDCPDWVRQAAREARSGVRAS